MFRIFIHYERYQEKLRHLIDKTDDSAMLENVYRYLLAGIKQPRKYLKDELSDADLNSLHEARAEYRRGDTIPLEKILELLRKWDEK